MTGYARIAHRLRENAKDGQTSFELIQEMVRFDYQYVAGWSLARDIEILLATLPAVMSGRGAY